MATLNDLTTAIANRITNAAQANASAPGLVGAAIVTEDTADLQTQIDKAIGNIGMLILIGEPIFDQVASEFSPTGTLKITLAVAIGEIPVIWRTATTKPKAKDVALIVTQLLHNLKIDGFVNLKVTHCHFIPDKQRQLFELTIITSMTSAPLPTP